MLFYYIRHGKPTYDPDCLTELGHEQAAALAKRLAVYGLDEIYSSSSTRAIQTAEPTAKILDKKINVLEWCHENLAWGELACTTENGERKWSHNCLKRLFAKPEVWMMRQNWIDHPEVKKHLTEGTKRIEKETVKFFANLGYEHDLDNCCYYYKGKDTDNRRIALFAHQGFGNAFLSCVLDIPYPLFCVHFDICHSGMTVLDFSADTDGVVVPKVLVHSDDSHIYKEGLDTYYNGEFRF